MKKLRINSSIEANTQPVVAAEESEVLDDAIEELKQNFDYVIEGFEKLGREGKEGQNQAQAILLELSAAIETASQSIAAEIA